MEYEYTDQSLVAENKNEVDGGNLDKEKIMADFEEKFDAEEEKMLAEMKEGKKSPEAIAIEGNLWDQAKIWSLGFIKTYINKYMYDTCLIITMLGLMLVLLGIENSKSAFMVGSAIAGVGFAGIILSLINDAVERLLRI